MTRRRYIAEFKKEAARMIIIDAAVRAAFIIVFTPVSDGDLCV